MTTETRKPKRTRRKNLASRGSSYIDPDRLYSLRGFLRCSGISETRLYEEQAKGNRLARIAIGNLHWVRGRDGIAFIEAASQPVE